MLATTGLAVSAIPAVTATSVANSDELSFHEKIQKGDKLLREEGKEARSDYLSGQDIPSGFVRGKFTSSRMEEQSEGEISPDRVDCIDPTQCDGDIDLIMSLSYNNDRSCYYTLVSVAIRYINYQSPYGGFYKGGEKPVDGLGFHWPEDEWKVVDRDDIPDSTNGDDNIQWDNGSWSPEGLAFEVDDKAMCTEPTGQEAEWSSFESGGVYVEKGKNWESNSSIYSTYLHTWEGTALGFSVGFPPSISLSGNSTAEADDVQTNMQGTTLRVTTSDIRPV